MKHPSKQYPCRDCGRLSNDIRFCCAGCEHRYYERRNRRNAEQHRVELQQSQPPNVHHTPTPQPVQRPEGDSFDLQAIGFFGRLFLAVLVGVPLIILAILGDALHRYTHH